MELITWTNEFEFGIESIDNQHRHLAALINTVSEHLNGDSQKEDVALAFLDLVEFVREHFDFEEDLFSKYNYPETQSHAASHTMLLAELDQIFDGKKPSHDVMSAELDRYLKKWLINHILVDDKKYAKHLIASGVS